MNTHFEIAVIGAGPGGMAAAINASKHNLSHILFEKRELGNTIFDYQLRKHVMAEPTKLPLLSQLPFEAGTRESILEAWNFAVNTAGVNVSRSEVKAIERQSDGIFKIRHGGGECTAMHVVLAIGIQGSPRRLGVPGEDLPHVAYTLADPDAFKDRSITVVGAGDAAIENALALALQNNVTVINRGAEFARAKDANNALITKAIENEEMKCLYNAEVAAVSAGKIEVNTAEGPVSYECDHIIARIGAIPPRKFLESCGITFPSKDMTALPAVNGRYESNVPNLFLIGSLIGYPLIKHAINQGFEVVQHIIGKPVEPADQPLLRDKVAALGSDVSLAISLLREALPLFSGLSEPQFRELILESTLHSKDANDEIFARNDYTDSFFSVVSGAAVIELQGGKQVRVSSGGFFGEMGLLSGRRRSATVRAGERSILLETPRKQIIKLCSSVESVKLAIDQKFLRNAFESSIFPGIEPNFLDELVTKARLKTFKKGEVLFREGEQGQDLYVVRKGSVKVSRLNSAGVDITQTYLAAGNYVGEMALLSKGGGTRNATVSAAVACETVVIDGTAFRELLDKSPSVRGSVERIARERLITNLTDLQDENKGKVLDFIISQGLTDADNVLVIDSDLCIACDNCEAACAATHDGYSRLDRKGGKSFAHIQIPISCRHCENPLCMTDCPPDALMRKPDGEVVIQDSCIGCGNCVRNCPYGVIKMVYEDRPGGGFSLLQMLGLGRKGSVDKGAGKAGKCDQCSDLRGGPACVRACPTGAALRLNPAELVRRISARMGVE